MEKFFLTLLTAFSFYACNTSSDHSITTDIVHNPATASGNTDTVNIPKMVFEEEVYDFGTISQGEKVTHRFTFQNTGKADLVITSAKGSCGCTVPSYPKNPIPPGGNESVEVTFDSNGKKGSQHKTVTIVANTNPGTNAIAIKGEVIAPEEKKN